ncbi:MAG: DUF4097 family beta strand repeat-containing protein [Marinilabilia sp.]
MRKLAAILFVALLGSSVFSVAQEPVDRINTQYEGVERVRVEGVFCDVSVERGDGDEVSLEGEIRSTRKTNDYAIRASRDGEELRIRVEHPKKMTGNVKGFLAFRAPADVSFEVDNVSGDIDVVDNAASKLSLKSVSGNIKIAGVGGEVKLKSTSGNIEASEVNGPLSISSVSGDQDISRVKGTLSASSTSGKITADMVEGHASINVTSGDMMLKNLEGGAGLKSTSGDIRIDVVKEKLSVKAISGDVIFSDVTGEIDIRTTSGDQKGKSVMFAGDSSFNSISGDINVDFTNIESALGFDLRSGSGKLSAGESASDERLVKEGGEFTIKGSTTSGDQKFY